MYEVEFLYAVHCCVSTPRHCEKCPLKCYEEKCIEELKNEAEKRVNDYFTQVEAPGKINYAVNIKDMVYRSEIYGEFTLSIVNYFPFKTLITYTGKRIKDVVKISDFSKTKIYKYTSLIRATTKQQIDDLSILCDKLKAYLPFYKHIRLTTVDRNGEAIK